MMGGTEVVLAWDVAGTCRTEARAFYREGVEGSERMSM